MKKFFSLFLSLMLVTTMAVAYASTFVVNDTEIEYESVQDLQKIIAVVNKQMVAECKTILFDAATYDAATYIVGETFPAGRYYVYPVVVSDVDTDLYPKVIWWNKEDVTKMTASDYVCAQWCYTIELTDGMKVKFDWDGDQRGVCIAMQKMPSTPTNLIDIFG